jgi:hypothetical protein
MRVLPAFAEQAKVTVSLSFAIVKETIDLVAFQSGRALRMVNAEGKPRSAPLSILCRIGPNHAAA